MAFLWAAGRITCCAPGSDSVPDRGLFAARPLPWLKGSLGSFPGVLNSGARSRSSMLSRAVAREHGGRRLRLGSLLGYQARSCGPRIGMCVRGRGLLRSLRVFFSQLAFVIFKQFEDVKSLERALFLILAVRNSCCPEIRRASCTSTVALVTPPS